jgi:hypothetical protein
LCHNQPFDGKHAQLDPHGPCGISRGRSAAPLRDGAATTDNSLVNFTLPHSGQLGSPLEFTKSSASQLHSWQRYS